MLLPGRVSPAVRQLLIVRVLLPGLATPDMVCSGLLLTGCPYPDVYTRLSVSSPVRLLESGRINPVIRTC